LLVRKVGDIDLAGDVFLVSNDEIGRLKEILPTIAAACLEDGTHLPRGERHDGRASGPPK